MAKTRKPNKAASALRAALVNEGRGAQRQLAEKLECGPELLSKWLAGQVIPCTRYRVQIQELHGIPLMDWEVQLKPKKGAA